MKSLAAFCTLVLFAALTTASAQEAKPTVLKGYVVDQMCAMKMAKKENVMEKAEGHSRECALEDDCAASGYGIFSDGKYYKFDEKGSAKAKALIEKSKREKKLYFEVRGNVGDGTIDVASIKEASPGKMHMTPPKSETKS
ncbi:MAG TPA: hypothetical protein VL126_11730 [Bacteroidota bacterium]|nr:hypothetical protein [Bacteroidota bacterium]